MPIEDNKVYNMPLKNIIKGQCSCGQSQFELEGKALFRVICHCNICQKYNQNRYADNTVFKVKNNHLTNPENHTFEYHRRPQIVARGRCSQCNMPTIEKFTALPNSNIVIIPNANLSDEHLRRRPAAHICYASRQCDVDDEVKKYDSDLMSQLAFSWILFKAYFFDATNNG